MIWSYIRTVCWIAIWTIALLLCVLAPAGAAPNAYLVVDSVVGEDGAAGTQDKPLRTLSAAIARLPDPLTASVTIEVRGLSHSSTGGVDMAPNRLELMRRMRPGVSVRIVSRRNSGEAAPVLSWEGGDCMVDVREGEWFIENMQIGTGSTRQRRGVMVTGPGHLTLKDVTFRTRSQSDAAIYAHRGGRVSLRGAISINEGFHDSTPAGDSFSGIIATDHGSVAFTEREGSSLDIGNGSLSASYYGTIELGCRFTRITSWGEQSNCLAINNSGRIDLHSTPMRLSAKRARNTPIGLEHDGHVLAEGARITIEGANDAAIVLQKASTIMCNDIELRGTYRVAVSAMSGSVFIGGFLGDVSGIEADTGAHVTIERIGGKLAGPCRARRGGSIALPNRNIVTE
jgi:hypothetical protein